MEQINTEESKQVDQRSNQADSLLIEFETPSATSPSDPDDYNPYTTGINQNEPDEEQRRYSLALQKEDSILYNNVLAGTEDDEEFKKIKVTDPVKTNDVVYYQIVAFDSDGEFQCTRRYSDFEALREAWKKRIPGLYYPFLPAKKFFGNTDKSHIEERRFMLEQFLRKVYKIQYLQSSEEFKVFARQSGQISVKGALEALPQQSVNILKFRIKQADSNIGKFCTQFELNQLRISINEAKEFSKAHLARMEQIRDMMKKFVGNQDEYMVENTNFVCEELSHYEEKNLFGYYNGGYAYKNSPFSRTVGQQVAETNAIFKQQSLAEQVGQAYAEKFRRRTMIDAQKSAADLSDNISYMKREYKNMILSFQNPYRQLYLWGSQEAMDLKALQECIASMESLEEKRKKLMKQVNFTEEQLNAIRPAQSSIPKNMFESAGNADAEAEMATKKAGGNSFDTQKDIIHYLEINEYLIQFLSLKWIPMFKLEKAKQYKLIVREFARLELQNNFSVRTMWTNVLDHHKREALFSKQSEVLLEK